jgi:hypothetical protein
VVKFRAEKQQETYGCDICNILNVFAKKARKRLQKLARKFFLKLARKSFSKKGSGVMG